MMRMFSHSRARTGSSADQYCRNGSMTIDTILEVPGEESPAPRKMGTASSSRPTFAWPFTSQSISDQHSTTQHSTQPSQSTSFPSRSNGWPNVRPASSVLGSDIIPDYVVNFLRGETPETLARRRERDGNPRTPDVHPGRNLTSRRASFFSLHSRLGSRGNLEAMLGAKKAGALGRFMTGWRGGVALNMMISMALLLLAIVAVVIAVVRKRLLAKPASILTGDCGRVRDVDLGLHAMLNVFALFFLAGGNYVAQVLASPTRTEVAKAHEKLRWLDIGIPSIRNLRGISRPRALLCVLVISISLALQIIFNSILYAAGSESPDDNTCSLYLNGPLLGAVAILNLLFILALAIALARPTSSNPLVTIGDAIVSFLMEPDHATEGACLVSKSDIASGRWGCGEARYWFNQSHRWWKTPSKIRWLTWFVTWLLPSGLAAAMLGMAVVDGPKEAFKSLSNVTSTYPLPTSIPRFGHALLLALPQILLAAFYFSTNALMSVFYLSHEFSQFANLGVISYIRISSGHPVGSQTTSLYLTLPRPLSWLLLILFAAMGFMLSQSFNLVQVGDEPAIGLNPLPCVILLGLLMITGLAVVLLSFRRSDVPHAGSDGRRVGNALALRGGSCSAVISARCHRSIQEGADMVTLPLSWGVVHDGGMESKVGHGTFSSQPVEPLNVAKAYA